MTNVKGENYCAKFAHRVTSLKTPDIDQDPDNPLGLSYVCKICELYTTIELHNLFDFLAHIYSQLLKMYSCFFTPTHTKLPKSVKTLYK